MSTKKKNTSPAPVSVENTSPAPVPTDAEKTLAEAPASSPAPVKLTSHQTRVVYMLRFKNQIEEKLNALPDDQRILFTEIHSTKLDAIEYFYGLDYKGTRLFHLFPHTSHTDVCVTRTLFEKLKKDAQELLALASTTLPNGGIELSVKDDSTTHEHEKALALMNGLIDFVLAPVPAPAPVNAE